MRQTATARSGERRGAAPWLPAFVLSTLLIGPGVGPFSSEALAAEPSVLQGRVWQHLAALPTPYPLTGVSVQPGDGGAWLVGDASGSVFLSIDGGQNWEGVLDPVAGLSPSGRRSLEGETAQDTMDDEEMLAEAEAVEGLNPESAASMAMRTAREQGLIAASARDPGRPWWHPAEPDIALVARPDGIWRSRDGGTVFQQVWPTGATGFALGPQGVLIAGTDDGVLYSTDAGATWIDVVDETDEIPVNAVVEAHGRLYAATEMGLYSSADGVRWGAVAGLPWGAVNAVAVDPLWKGGLWAATDSALMRSDDGGSNFYSAGRQPMRGLVGLALHPDSGLLLAWGADGVWASGDGGVSWAPHARLLTEPDVRGLGWIQGELIIATASGLWRYVAPGEVEDLKLKNEQYLPLRDAVAVSVRRPGLDTASVALSTRQAAARFVPNLEMGVHWSDQIARQSYLIDGYTLEPQGGGWQVWTRLCWGSCSTTASYSTTDADTIDAVESAIADAVDEGKTVGEVVDEVGDLADMSLTEELLDATTEDMFVTGGTVYSADDVVSAAANVSQQILRYRTRLGGDVAAAWISRQRLAEDRAIVGTRSLQAQVEHELKIAELDARLDIWTNGAFTRSLTTIEAKP